MTFIFIMYKNKNESFIEERYKKDYVNFAGRGGEDTRQISIST